MTSTEFNALTLSEQAAVLAALRSLLAEIYAQRGGASEPQPVTVTRRMQFGTAQTGTRGREN